MQMQSLRAKLVAVLGVVLLIAAAVWLRYVGVHEAEVVLGAFGAGVVVALFLGERDTNGTRSAESTRSAMDGEA